MKTLSYSELTSFANWLSENLNGAQLQNVWTNDQVLVFEFYLYKSFWLCVDLSFATPYVAVVGSAPKIPKISKPLSLFLNAHAKNLRLLRAFTQIEEGRILFLQLAGADRLCEIKMILIPRAVNVLVQAGDKKMSWQKPKELPKSSHAETENDSKDILFDWPSLGAQWFTEKFLNKATTPNKSSVKDPFKNWRKDIEKKQKALAELEKDLDLEIVEKWKALGEWLKGEEPLPENLLKIYDSKKSRTWNMENAFAKAKEYKRKQQGRRERVNEITKQIEVLQNKIDKGELPPPNIEKRKSIFEKSDSKGRKKVLASGFEVVIGRSAKDNLAILRQARAWDLWLHLRDYPGAHAIIFHDKNKEVPLSALEEASQWLIQESFAGKKIDLGSRYEIVVVECRHVRPIKGDKLGRVTYHNPQVYSFASKSKS